MNGENQKWSRRNLLKMTTGLAAAGNGGQLVAAEAPVELDEAHRRAVDRQRRIVVQMPASQIVSGNLFGRISVFPQENQGVS